MADGVRRREGQQLLLRFPEGSDLRDRLEKIAQGNQRSLSAEIIYQLEQAVALSEQGVPLELETRFRHIEMRLYELENRS